MKVNVFSSSEKGRVYSHGAAVSDMLRLKGEYTMKKVLVIANMLFASATVWGMENSQISQQGSDQTQRFVTALRSGDIEQVEQSIRDGADVNNTEIDGTTPLIFAANADDGVLVDTLIRLGADANAEDNHHKTALSVAVDNDSDHIPYLLVKIGRADIYKNGVFDRVMRGPDNEVQRFLSGVNLSSLVKAIKNSDVDGVKKALEDERIDINRRDDIGYTPLMYAALGGNLDIVDLLIDNGASVDITSNSEDNAMFFAARNGYTEVLSDLMLKYIANIDYKTVKKALCNHPHRNDKNLLKSNIVKVAKDERMKSAFAERNDLNQTLLISALKNGREDTALWLIEHGAGVNDIYKAKYGDLHRGWSAYEESPLMIAAALGQPRAVSKLLKKGADISFENEKGTALDYVLQSEEKTPRELRDQVVQILINKGLPIADNTKAFRQAINRGYLATVQGLMESIEDVNLRKQEGLGISVKKGYFDIAEFLLQNGADINLSYTVTKDSWNEKTIFKGALLHWAVREGYSDTVDWLIKHGANVNSQGIVKIEQERWYGSTRIRKETPLSIAESELSKVQSELSRVQSDEESEEEVTRSRRVQWLQKESESWENIVSLLRNAGAESELETEWYL